MRKSILAVAVVLFAGSAMADTNAVSVGYQRDSIGDGGYMGGVSAMYVYTPANSALSFVSTASYTGADMQDSDNNNVKYAEARKFSLTAGTGYNVNSWLMPYAVLGVSHASIKITNDEYTNDGKSSDTGFVYGAGVQFTLPANITARVGYEGTKLLDTNVNGFNVGLGYKF